MAEKVTARDRRSPSVSPSTYYFARKRSSSLSYADDTGVVGSVTTDVMPGSGKMMDYVPEGAAPVEFSSRPVIVSAPITGSMASTNMSAIREVEDEGPGAADKPDATGDVGTLLLERRVPMKVEVR